MIRPALVFGLICALAHPAQARDPIPLFAAPREMLSPPFLNEANHKLNLTNFRGKVVLLNVWATWCIPCREEMPTLDALEAQLGGKDFQVVALSIDKAGFPAIKKFFTEYKIAHLNPYLAESLRVAAAFAVYGLPTTILIDRNGRELGRTVGPEKWDSSDSVAFFQSIIAKKEN
ncbi:MAG: TlpA family protein disulfide reductase [Paracoccaceae bacterium]|nr:TlpA family protein disulfide reductase [Paracoccaceae bacterium]